MSGQLRSSVGTYIFEYADEKEKPLYNTNKSITIGGVVKSQADSVRLEIALRVRIMQSDLHNLTAIIDDFSSALYYTPTRVLWDRQTISEMTVIVSGGMEAGERIKSDGKGYYLDVVLEEVIEQ